MPRTTLLVLAALLAPSAGAYGYEKEKDPLLIGFRDAMENSPLHW